MGLSFLFLQFPFHAANTVCTVELSFVKQNSPCDELHTLRKYRIQSNLKRLKKEAKQQRGRQCIINEWASDQDKQHERLKVSEREMKKRIKQTSEAR